MIKVAFIGGGGHAQCNHLPALRRFQTLHPGLVELCAFCDLNPMTAQQTAQSYGFAQYFTDLPQMLASQTFDACIAITPVKATADVATAVMKAGIALLMEKPPGSTLEQARTLCDTADQYHSNVTVSMNRRFDPVVAAACAWRDAWPLQHLQVSMFRIDRNEPGFINDTASQCVDAARHIAGNIVDCRIAVRLVDRVNWYHLNVRFVSDVTGVIDIFPTCGRQAEAYQLFSTKRSPELASSMRAPLPPGRRGSL